MAPPPTLDKLKASASLSFHRASSALGIETSSSLTPQENQDALDELSDMCPKLTYQQRIVGFGICFALGYLITFLSFRLFFNLMAGDPIPFVMAYTLGNVMSLFSSMFLCGPKRQFKNMFDKKRRMTTIVYLTSFFLTIVLCFLPMDDHIRLFLVLILLVVQVCANLWYSLSYIPFARRHVSNYFREAVGLDDQV